MQEIFKSLLKEGMVGAAIGLQYHRASFKIIVVLIVQDTIFPVKFDARGGRLFTDHTRNGP